MSLQLNKQKNTRKILHIIIQNMCQCHISKLTDGNLWLVHHSAFAVRPVVEHSMATSAAAADDDDEDDDDS